MGRPQTGRARKSAPQVPSEPARRRALLVGLTLLAAFLPAASGARSFWAFETGPVRPLALSADGSRLYAVNTPDARLEIFALGPSGPQHLESVPVGLEPCAVAARDASEVWVVNHLSDSVSIVDVSTTPARVVRTLLVGDEPRDIVFAGSGGSRAFITTAHRGQNHPNDPQLETAGAGRADVFVFDVNALGSGLGGTPETILSLFGDTPRALATSGDGSLVYAAVFHSGNQTTILPANAATQLPPSQNEAAPIAPTPLQSGIVGFDGSDWRDALGGIAPAGAVRLTLPDQDVFTIDADAPTPSVVADHRHVGTALFNMAVNPQSGVVYVSNTDANNRDRFEGFSATWGNLRGELHKARITVLDGPSVLPRHLNKHLAALPEYAAEGNPTANANSLATPLAMAVSSDGNTLYVAAFGSAKVGVFDTAELLADTFTPDASTHIELSSGGPAGLALDEPRNLLYVYKHFDRSIGVIGLGAAAELHSVPLHNPEPDSIVAGRPFLYDARAGSSNGEASCAGCHVFADLDHLAWDLGVPEAPVEENHNPFEAFPPGFMAEFHPLKGPMTTQTLRGLDHHGPMHWRGDRTATPGGPFDDEVTAFVAFNGAFVNLLGRTAPLPAPDMQAFADFVLQIVSPPNPIRDLSNSLTPNQQLGRDIFFGPITGTRECSGCHALDPAQGLFGTSGESSIEGFPHQFKIPQLRNMVQKVGMFGSSSFLLAGSPTGDPNDPQIRGFGYFNDGAVDTLTNLFAGPGFFFDQAVIDFDLADEAEAVAAVVDFVFAFPSELAPAVGQQVTLASGNAGLVGPRVALLEARAQTAFDLVGEPGAMECDLVVKGTVGGVARGWWLDAASGDYLPDAGAEPPLGKAALEALAGVAGQELTYTCAPPGAGARMGIDRDEDASLDLDDNCPAAPNGPGGGTCTAGEPLLLGAPCTSSPECGAGGSCSLAQEDTDTDGTGDACDPVFVPEPAPWPTLVAGALLVSGLGRRRSNRLPG